MSRLRLRALTGFAAVVLATAGFSIPSGTGSAATARATDVTPLALPSSWSEPALVDDQPPFGHPPGLGGISCPTASFCVAVGWAGNGIGNIATSNDPTGGTEAWKVVYQIDNGSLISDVSCPSTSLCVATDAAGNVITSTDPAGDASAWTVTSIASQSLKGISCPSASLCVVVDNNGNVITSTNPTGGAGAWTTTNVEGFNVPSGVSCPTTTLCVAVDIYDHVVTSTNPTGGTGAWSVAHIDSGGNHSLLAVSCPTSSLCVAVDDAGNLATSTNPTGGAGAWTSTNIAAAVWDGASISCPSVSLCVLSSDNGGHMLTSTNPTGGAAAWFAADVSLSYVSCPSASLCVASSGSGNSIVTSTNPTGGADAWNSVALGFSGLTGASCPSPALCVVVDDGGNVLTSTDPAGGSWSFAHVDGPAVDPNGLTAVSCPSASLCVAVDDAGNVLASTNPSGGAGAWTAAHVDGTNRLWSVSCPSASLCVAGDGAGNVVTSTNPTGGAGAWAVTHVDNATTGLNYLSGVSCPSSSLCVAGDSVGNAVFGIPANAHAPTNLTPPAVTGRARLGETLTCSDGTWNGAPTSYSRHWYRNDTVISGATARTHQVVNSDLQRALTCAVTATNAGGSSVPAVSEAVAVKAVSVVSERETTKSGTTRACGGSTSGACRDAKGATVHFAGKATPVPIPAATRRVVVHFYHRSHGVWQQKATSTILTASSSGAWHLGKTGVTSLKGAWRVKVTAAATPTLTTGVSAYRYYQVP